MFHLPKGPKARRGVGIPASPAAAQHRPWDGRIAVRLTCLKTFPELWASVRTFEPAAASAEALPFSMASHGLTGHRSRTAHTVHTQNVRNVRNSVWRGQTNCTGKLEEFRAAIPLHSGFPKGDGRDKDWGTGSVSFSTRLALPLSLGGHAAHAAHAAREGKVHRAGHPHGAGPCPASGTPVARRPCPHAPPCAAWPVQQSMARPMAQRAAWRSLAQPPARRIALPQGMQTVSVVLLCCRLFAAPEARTSSGSAPERRCSQRQFSVFSPLVPPDKIDPDQSGSPLEAPPAGMGWVPVAAACTAAGPAGPAGHAAGRPARQVVYNKKASAPQRRRAYCRLGAFMVRCCR